MFSKFLNSKIFAKIRKWWENQKGYRSFTLLPPSHETGFYCKVVTIGITRKGNVGCYRIIPLRDVGRTGWNIIIKLDYLPELSLAMPSRYQSNEGFISGKEYCDKFKVSHRLTVLKEFTSGSMLPIFICDLNLLEEGIRKQIRSSYLHRAITESLRKVAWKCLYISHYTDKTHDMTWAGQIVRVNYANWLINEIRLYLRDETYKIESYLIYLRELD